MRLNSKESLFGQPVLKIRAIVRQAMAENLWGTSRAAIAARISEILMEPEKIAADVLNQLLTEEYLVINEVQFPGRIQYEAEATEKGRRFGMATANPAITRQKADKLLKELIRRAGDINANDEYAFYVERLYVFGSYLTDKPLLSDLDVFYKLTRKYEGERGTEKGRQRVEIAFNAGRRFQNYIEQLCWPQKEVLLALKTREKGLSLHDEEGDDVFAKTTSRLVYKADKFLSKE